MTATARPARMPFETHRRSGEAAEDPPVDPSDARLLNWRFLVPDEPEGLLLLPVRTESLPGAVVPRRTLESFDAALSKQPFPAVACPDLGAWAGLAGGPERLVRRLMDAVQPVGWLHLGFANLYYPGRPLARGSVRPGRIEHLLREHGFEGFDRYLAFPSEDAPAFLVPAHGGEQLDYFLRRLAFPYSDVPGGRFGGPRASMRSLMLRGAVAAPNSVRVHLAPAFAYVAVRRAAP
jgi:hypothetical protein